MCDSQVALTGTFLKRRVVHSALIVFLLWSPSSQARLSIDVQSQGDTDALEGAVLTATPINTGTTSARKSAVQQVSMEQVNRQFQPFILPVPIGVPVEFPNRDRTAHHVYSFSTVRTFELPLYKGTFPEPITFDKPGVVPLGCNIHDWMLGYIFVVDAPFYTQIFNQSADFDDLPPGKYEIGIWHPSLEKGQVSTWIIDVEAVDSHRVLSLESSLLAARQPIPPTERFDERADY